jgi:hypothetical protein
VEQLVAQFLERRLGFVPEWLPSEKGPDAALVQIAARYWQAIIQRLNQAPVKNKLAFFSTLGIQLISAQAARTPIVFRLSDNAKNARLPANARIAAPPPPESNNQIIFETERATGLAAAKLKEVVSLWPGRDQYIDHSAPFLAGKTFQLFAKKLLEDTPHHIYIGHKTLLALSGASVVSVIFELRTASSEQLQIIWEYWDGKTWRQFKRMQPKCDEAEASRLDSTDGLRHSGQFVLETDCAETSVTTVNNIESFWIRGRLDERLPPNSQQVLPDAESVRLSTSIAQPIEITLERKPDTQREKQLSLHVTDELGAPLRGVGANLKFTDGRGMAELPTVKPFKVVAGDFEDEVTLDPQPTDSDAVLSLAADGLKPDKAFADGETLDVTKPFFPLGLQPQPGAAFYFTNEEIFSKPGASMQVYVQPAVTAQDQLSEKPEQPGVVVLASVSVPARDGISPLPHTVSWEYWNGTDWIQLDGYSFIKDRTSPRDFTGVGLIASLVIPFDMAKLEVNGEEKLWMRVRLASGAYGFRNTIVDARNSSQFDFVVQQPPSVGKFVLGYTWQKGPVNADYVLTYNDFQYEDQSKAARLPGLTFQPFKPVADRTPTLYLGFDQKLPEDRLAMLFNFLEDANDTKGPALLWQYWDGFVWEDFLVEDETRDFRVPGLVSFIGPDDSQALARFGTSRHWLRARLKEDGPPGSPVLNGLFLNAVHAIQHQTIVNEAMGSSTGQPDQTLSFTQVPVLAGEIIEVREVSGLRANVEWRIVAFEILGRASDIAEMESLLANEGTQTEISVGDVRLTRDRNKRVTEVWVRWHSRPHLLFSGPDDRDYVVDRAQGLLLFGDGTNGKVPPSGAAILARQYRTGGGNAGNVEAGKISQLLAPAGGIEEAFNPLPASGGADGESPKQYEIRAPQSIRHRGRALLAGDFEAMALEASPAVGFARVIPGRDSNGRRVPGWITLLIIPRTAEPRPIPSFGLREEIRQYIEERTAAELAAGHRINVTAPNYLPIDVDTTIVPVDPAEAGSVEQSVLASLEAFFHPLTGGPEGAGWELGRDLFASDVAAVLEHVRGVDYVTELHLLLNSELQDESVEIAADRIVVAGQFRVNIVAGRIG